jgi:hypothetical protein
VLLRRMASVAWLAQCLVVAAAIGPSSASESQAGRWDAYVRESEDLALRHGFVRFQADGSRDEQIP